MIHGDARPGNVQRPFSSGVITADQVPGGKKTEGEGGRRDMHSCVPVNVEEACWRLVGQCEVCRVANVWPAHPGVQKGMPGWPTGTQDCVCESPPVPKGLVSCQIVCETFSRRR